MTDGFILILQFFETSPKALELFVKTENKTNPTLNRLTLKLGSCGDENRLLWTKIWQTFNNH